MKDKHSFVYSSSLPNTFTVLHPPTLEEGAARKVLVGPSYETEELRIQVIRWMTTPGEQFIKWDGLWNALPSHHVLLPLDSTGDMMATTLWAFTTGRKNKCWSLELLFQASSLPPTPPLTAVIKSPPINSLDFQKCVWKSLIYSNPIRCNPV